MELRVLAWPLFPKGVRLAAHLPFYATWFDTTELNAPFYRTPTPEAVRSWYKSTPDEFVFAWKASRFITHWKRLTESCVNSIALMDDRLQLLKHKAGPILFQLPSRMKADRERLEGFFKLLPKGRLYAFEFRHPSWFEPRIFDVLRDHNTALCLSDHCDAPTPWERTASFMYVRGHGPTGRYHGHYPDEALDAWARHITRWCRHGHDVYCYFDNDQKSAAPLDAARLQRCLNMPTGAGKLQPSNL